MNKFRTLVIATFLAGGISGCHKSSPPTTHFFKATVNGGSFVATSITYTLNNTSSKPFTEVIGFNSFGEIDIKLFYYPGVAETIPVKFTSGTTLYATVNYFVSGTGSHNAVYGSVVITNTGPDFTGTFYCTTNDSTKITEGSFNAATF